MAQQYMVRVGGREYGPVVWETLRDWAVEGRLLPATEVRVVENQNWFAASTLERVFGEPEPERPATGSVPPPLPEVEAGPVTAGSILDATWNHYLRGIGTFFLLMVPVGLSGLLASFAGEFVEQGGEGFDRWDAAGCVLLVLSLALYAVAWPIAEGGIVLGTSDLAEGRPVRAQPLLARSLRHRRGLYSAAFLSWAIYSVWMLFGGGAIFVATLGLRERSGVLWLAVCAVIALLLVWQITRLFLRFLFRAQATVFQGIGGADAIRHSAELASENAGPFFRRPLWAAILIYLVWTVLMVVASLVTVIPLTALIFGTQLAGMQESGQTPSLEALDPSAIPLWPWKALSFVVQALIQTVLQAYPIVGCTLLYLSRRSPRPDPSITPEPAGESPGKREV